MRTSWVKKIKYATFWHVRYGLFDPLTFILISIIVLALYFIVTSESEATIYHNVSLALECTLLPLYALSSSLYLIRDQRVLLFEINMFKDLRCLYISKIISFVISFLPLLVTLSLIGTLFNSSWIILPLTVKIITYASLFASAILLKNTRAALLYLATTYMIVPLSSLVVLTTIVTASKQLIDPLFSVFFYYVSPITMVEFSKFSVIPLSKGYIIALLMSLVIISLSMIIFERLEYDISE